MSVKEFVDRYKGVRRTVLGICVTWTSAAVVIGLWAMISKGLSGPDSAFLTAVIALMQVPVAFYFQQRGMDDRQ